MKIRTRFAPSPTGNVHIGNIRAAIFNWLFARHNDGAFLLRVEDTDRERSTPEACNTVLAAMEWLGLNFDEEPLYQSTRQEAHLAAAEDLLSRGLAYREDKGDTGQGEAVIFRMPGSDAAFTDLVKGPLNKKAENMQDFVIVRSNGTPVFHLANVVDDIHMGITHVIRGDDHVENTFRHLALFEALGADLPAFAHLPMIVNAQGKPYSKRDGDAYVGEFREKGILGEALFNYLALLGWNPGDDREVFSRTELVEAFSLDRVLSSAAQMDLQKLAWMNGRHMRMLPAEDYQSGIRTALEQAGLIDGSVSDAYFDQVVNLVGDRINLWTDAPAQAGYFFKEELEQDDYNAKGIRKRLLKEGIPECLQALSEVFQGLENFDAATIDTTVHDFAEEQDVGIGKIMPALRLAATGAAGGPDLFPTLAVLGRDRVCQRISQTLELFPGG